MERITCIRIQLDVRGKKQIGINAIFYEYENGLSAHPYLVESTQNTRNIDATNKEMISNFTSICQSYSKCSHSISGDRLKIYLMKFDHHLCHCMKSKNSSSALSIEHRF